jgi:UPF0716 protein FxsA
MLRSVTTTVIVWLFAECIVFLAVVQTIGLIGAIALGVLTSCLGATMLRRVGAGAVMALRQAANGLEPSDGGLLDGSLIALGGVLLLLPGFLSDMVGIALASPSFRQWLARRFSGRSRRRRIEVIDLSPQEWRSVNDLSSH